MKRLKKILLFLLLIIPCFVKADMYSYDPDAIARANSYINEYNDRNKYLLFNKNYAYNAGRIEASSRYINGGMLNKDEFLTTRVDGGSYLATGNEYWTMTPANANTMYTVSYILKSDKNIINDTEGVRVTEYVQHDAKVTGTGRKTDPWMFVTQYRVSVTSSNNEIGTVDPSEQFVSKGGDASFDILPKRGYRYIKANCSGLEADPVYNKSTKKLTFNRVNNDIGCIVDFDRAIYTFNLDNTNTSKKSVPEKIYLELDSNWYKEEDAENPITTITPPERTGYNFVKYQYNGETVIDSTGKLVKVVSIPNDQLDVLVQTLQAVWDGKTYKITLNGNGATSTPTTQVNVKFAGSLASSPSAPSKSYTVKYDLNGSGATQGKTTDTSNYTFDGWYTEATGGVKVINANGTLVNSAEGYVTNGKWSKADNVTLYARFSGGNVTTSSLTKTGNSCKWYPNKNNNNNPVNPNTSYTPTANITFYAKCGADTYSVTLNQNGATKDGSTSATVTYGAGSLSKITVPQRKYTVKFDVNGTGATASSTSNKTSTYTFSGWFTASSGGSKVASNAATPALQKSVSGYTNASKKWIRTESSTTLYAQLTGGSVTLPTVTKKGYTCSWNTKSDGSGTSIKSGGSYTPTSGVTLYARCSTKTYTVTLNQNGATTDGTTSTTVKYAATSLATISSNPQKKYTVKFDKNSSGATFGDTSDKVATYSFAGWYSAATGGSKVASNALTPALQANVSGYTNKNGKWNKDGKATLYARFTGGTITLPSATKSGKNCYWRDGSTDYEAGSSYKVTKNVTLKSVCTFSCHKWIDGSTYVNNYGCEYPCGWSRDRMTCGYYAAWDDENGGYYCTNWGWDGCDSSGCAYKIEKGEGYCDVKYNQTRCPSGYSKGGSC